MVSATGEGTEQLELSFMVDRNMKQYNSIHRLENSWLVSHEGKFTFTIRLSILLLHIYPRYRKTYKDLDANVLSSFVLKARDWKQPKYTSTNAQTEWVNKP